MTPCDGQFTVKGLLLHDSPLEDLEVEADAARCMKARGWQGSYGKLDAIEREIMFRKAIS